MNFAALNNVSGPQRCRKWFPLITQQLRLRHVCQIMAYNLIIDEPDDIYFTLHLTAMSAPFYTSEKLLGVNLKWSDIVIKNLSNGSSTALVIRIWKATNILLTWGVNLSGLVYLGNKISEIQPESFKENTVILCLRNCYYTCLSRIIIDSQEDVGFMKNINVINTEESTKVYRTRFLKLSPSEIKKSYNLGQLRQLQSMQLSLKNKIQDTKIVEDRINVIMNGGVEEKEPPKVPADNVRYAPQLLTMNSLNKMLQEKPTRLQRLEIVRVRKEIETSRLKTKTLMHEKERKLGQIRQLKNIYGNLCDDNEDRSSQLMENYRYLSKEIEKLRQWRKECFTQRDVLQNLARKLHNRRRQLMSDLLYLYPIDKIDDTRYTINGVYLPPSDILGDCSDNGLSVALGYVTHVLIMCASFLQVPLRYPLQHIGSRSIIEDHITPLLTEKTREFPLYTRGKDRMQFNYAVYLLNKNIAQYLYMLGARTPDLKATIANVLSLLQGRDYPAPKARIKEDSRSKREGEIVVHFGSSGSMSDPVLTSMRHEYNSQSPTRRRMKSKKLDTGPGLGQILAVPEAFLNKQISSTVFKNYLKTDIHIKGKSDCDRLKIEEGEELMPCEIEITKNGTEMKQKRMSRSEGSYDGDEDPVISRASFELGSEPLLNLSSEAEMMSDEISQQKFLQKWLDSGPSLVCSEECLYPEEVLGRTISKESPLTTRTDALLSTKSFNLVKPKL